MNPKRLTAALLAALTIFYPLAVYFGIAHFGPAFFAALLLLAALARFFLARDRAIAQTALLGLAAVYSVILAISGSEFFLKLYPSVMSTCIGGMFFLSAFQSQSLIERMARLRGKHITARAQSYTRKLTLVWAVLLFINAAVAGYLAAFASIEQWAFYSGLLSYLAFAVFAVLEYIYRRHYIRKYEGGGTESS